LDKRQLFRDLLDHFQSDFPIERNPFEVIAHALKYKENEVREGFKSLLEEGFISRVGPVFGTHKVGYSFLAAVKCPTERIEEVASVINSFDEVNHNYLRENELNLWFVVTGKNAESLDEVIEDLEKKIGLPVFRFPMIRPFKIDLQMKGAFK